MDDNLKRFLVVRAKETLTTWGWESLLQPRRGGACGCMGARDGEPYCECEMENLLHKHLPVIINEIDPEIALKIMRQRLVAALGG